MSLLAKSLLLFLSLLLLSAAWHKWRDIPNFTRQLAAYRLLPPELLAAGSRLVPLLEISAALLLWLGIAWPAAALFALYAAAMAVNLQRGRSHIDCGCGDTPVLLRPGLLWRNLLLSIAAFWAVPGTALWQEWLFALPAALSFWVAYAALNQLFANQDKLILQEGVR